MRGCADECHVITESRDTFVTATSCEKHVVDKWGAEKGHMVATQRSRDLDVVDAEGVLRPARPNT
ncbi:hypothetical protein M501DRAFT_996632, partial [Patellaria atrata CBS 101060]